MSTGLDKIPAEVLENDLCVSFRTTLFNTYAHNGLIPGARGKTYTQKGVQIMQESP